MQDATLIDTVEAFYCRVPLEDPIVLGEMLIGHRDFVLVRVTTRSGIVGSAYALTRGAPVDLVVSELLGPALLGKEALDTPRRAEELARAIVALGTAGIVLRAMSLLEICLWDIKGQVAGLPVWRLLGGQRDHADVLLVAPYALPSETDEAYALRLGSLAERGYAAVKLYPLLDASAMRRRLVAVRRSVGQDIGLVIDMAWSWRTREESIAAVRTWEDFSLDWVEDPHVSTDWRAIKALAASVETPIGAGDEVSVRETIETLILERAVDVLRLDATTIGGLGAFGAVRQLAAREGLPVSPHAYPEIHRHCVFAWPDVGPIEIFPPGSPTWGASRFLEDELDLPAAGTHMNAPTEPGLGLHIDWDAATSVTLRATAASTSSS